MAPYEAFYGKIWIFLIEWFDVDEAELIGPELVYQTMEKVKVIPEKLKWHRVAVHPWCFTSLC